MLQRKKKIKKQLHNGKVSRKRRIGKRSVLLTVTVLLVLALLSGWLYYVFLLRGSREPRTLRKTTNTGAVFYRSHEKMKEEMRVSFPHLTTILKDSVIVPGLRATEALQGEFHALSMCTSMVPQGMCVTEDYIFVSAYCYTHRHNSTLYMIDRKSKKLIRTVPLGGKAHVGGMAYDPKHRNVWVSGGTKGSAKAIAYSLDALEEYDISSKKPIRHVFNYTLATIDRNSYMTYSDNSLWIGYYTSSGLSQIERFDLTEEGGMDAQIIADFDSLHESVPADFIASTSGRIQGAAKNSPYLYLSQSYGISDSRLQIFRFTENRMRFVTESAERIWRFPQKMEQICVYDDQLYCLFESAGYAYSAQPALIIDRILIFDVKDLNPQEEEVVDITRQKQKKQKT